MVIIANLKGFTLAHQVIVMDNEKLISMSKASVKDMPELICHLAKEYNCNKVILTGAKKYTENINDRMQGIYKAKYADREPLEVEYITK